MHCSSDLYQVWALPFHFKDILLHVTCHSIVKSLGLLQDMILYALVGIIIVI